MEILPSISFFVNIKWALCKFCFDKLQLQRRATKEIAAQVPEISLGRQLNFVLKIMQVLYKN
jgi:hypothetical protein